MKNIPLLKVYFCALALLSVSVSARTVFAEIDLFSDSYGPMNTALLFPSDSSVKVITLPSNEEISDFQVYEQEYADSMDLFLHDYCWGTASDLTTACFHFYTDSPGFWVPKDSSRIDFRYPLDLEDTSLFSVSSLGMFSTNTMMFVEANAMFIFQTNIGEYAFCHSHSIDTAFGNGVFLTQTYSRMYLACQVQEDGTPTFDSIPQYKEPPVALPPLRLRTMQKQRTPSAPYRVNGTSAGTSRATSIRVGKETTIRDQ